ncbi:MAG TPA: SGNH/GDSL hydrolase family protein [Burkholderiales bacterium]|nr:SGNH/GDSL hydrolase family protein [Burkholderiales bacterium]
MKRTLTNLSLVLSGLLAGALFFEIVLRLIGFSFPLFYRYDVHAGHRLLEGAEGWYRMEGEAYVRINGQGMRDDREITVRKAQGVYRIAVLGDSFTQAKELPVEKSFWRLLEVKLNQCKPFAGKAVEVLNFGVDGYSTAQELQALRHRVWQFQPDMVLLAFYSGNDIQDNSREFATDHMQPTFAYRDGQLVLDDSFLAASRYQPGLNIIWLMHQQISQYSRVLQLLNKARDMAHQAVRRPTKHASANEGPTELFDYHKIYLQPREDSAWENAWRVTEGLVVQMSREVAAGGATFVIVTLSKGIQVHPDSKEREAYARYLGVTDLFYPEKRIQALAKTSRLRLISLAEPFQKHAEENRVYLHGYPNATVGFGHWNDKGHALAAKMISEELCKTNP